MAWARALRPPALLLSGLMLLWPHASLRAAEPDGQILLLDVQINGRPIGRVAEFTLHGDGTLSAAPNDLREIGLRLPPFPSPAPLSASGPQAGIDLASLPRVAWRVDQPSQTIFLTAPMEALAPNVLRGLDGRAPSGPTESGTGAVLNYDVDGVSANRQALGSALVDLRGFSPAGTLSAGALGHLGGGPGGPGVASAVRLDTTFVASDTDTLRQYRLGDFVTGGLGWTRPVRMGGAQLAADFTTRPDLVTMPLPSISGAVAVPSTVDVLANGNRVFSGQAEPGPFEIRQLPVTGAGAISATVTNALGRQVVVSLPFYVSAALLAEDLQTFSLQAGAVRRNWGVLSDDYGDTAVVGAYRRGLSASVTVEASVEGTSRGGMAGGGAVVNLGDIAILNVAAAGSAGMAEAGAAGAARPSGGRLSVGVQRIGPTLSLSVAASAASRGFRDVAALNGDPVPRLQLSASAGLSLGAFGSFSVAYAGIDRDARPSPLRVFLPPGAIAPAGVSRVGQAYYIQPAQRAHVVSASHSVEIGGVSFYATGYRDLARGGAAGVLFGLTLPLGARRSLSATAGAAAGGGGNGQIQVAQAAVEAGDWGYQAYAARGLAEHEFAQAQYKSPVALLTAGVDRLGAQTALHAEAQGALAYADGRPFASNAIPDSFAVVDTNGLGGVRVLRENRLVGETDSGGRLLVPDLRAFNLNRIAIEPTDVPQDVSIDASVREVRPQALSGVVVKFPVKASHAALLELVEENGAPVPLGSRATPLAGGPAVPVGYDGAAYVTDLAARNRLRVERPDGSRCVVGFDYRAVAGSIPRLGPLTCRAEAP